MKKFIDKKKTSVLDMVAIVFVGLTMGACTDGYGNGQQVHPTPLQYSGNSHPSAQSMAEEGTDGRAAAQPGNSCAGPKYSSPYTQQGRTSRGASYTEPGQARGYTAPVSPTYTQTGRTQPIGSISQ